ncbi:FG-GAP repeat domain-containing protein [Tropicibacter sp. S64]|uniref:FG-GAP repeat domain-containing protein n=1 Tax=Tropicibacter sp. S64 TaxID=3415122 RepID=UPI003C7CD991
MAGAPRLPLRAWHGRVRGAVLTAALVVVAAGASACEAVGDGYGLPGRFAETEVANATPGGGRHEGWAPRGARFVMHAGYDVETDEYGHGVLGGLRDAKVLTIHLRIPGDARITCPKGVRLPEGQVFEDIAPRLADLDGDGMPEILAVRSTVNGGASLVVYDRFGRERAATPPIGQRNRWLAPVGAADLDGDGAMEIAYVDRPHLAKVLRIWRYDGVSLREVAAAEGVSNHRIGREHIAGGVRNCGQGPEMIVADGDFDRLLALRFTGTALSRRDLGTWSDGAAQAALACR